MKIHNGIEISQTIPSMKTVGTNSKKWNLWFTELKNQNPSPFQSWQEIWTFLCRSKLFPCSIYMSSKATKTAKVQLPEYIRTD